MATQAADHGGGIDAAAARFGGTRADWLDLSTGINPLPYPVPPLRAENWTALPDQAAQADLIAAARAFWAVPAGAAVLAAPGASALIARIPLLAAPGVVRIAAPTYNEHGRAFAAAGWSVATGGTARAAVMVNPNNPDGRLWQADQIGTQGLTVIDESFAEVTPAASLIGLATRPGTLILKSFGKFWGLAGLRLGFAIGDPALVAKLAGALGPWPVSGPALQIGTTALQDSTWTAATRTRLSRDTARLDRLMQDGGARLVGGCDLFRLYDVGDAAAWQTGLARARIWTRIFPYSNSWLRLGLPGTEADWARLEAVLQQGVA